MKIAIYGSRRQHTCQQDIRSLLRNLVLGGAEVLLADKLYDHLSVELGMSMPGISRVREFPAGTNLAISIGGDGTFLRTVAWVENREIPVLGINTGHLGYLAALSLPEAVESVDRILSLDFRTEYHTLLHVEADGLKGWPMALNEVVVAKEDSSSMITTRVDINGHYFADYKADGLIVSTPTGSTAYNLSVGGPIVEPSAPVWVLSPIAAHSLTVRPLVVADTSEIILRSDGRGHRFRLVLDGRSTSLELGSAIRLCRAMHRVAILQRHDRDFARTISTKLMFNG